MKIRVRHSILQRVYQRFSLENDPRLVVRFFVFLIALSNFAFAENTAPPAKPGNVELPSPEATGGGWTDAGLIGDYYSGANATGVPAFERRDVRIDFDGKTKNSLGGSTGEPYRSFPLNNFTVVWKGHLIPRFSEEYTFKVMTPEMAKVEIKATDAGDKAQTSFSSQKGVAGTGTLKLVSGKNYDVQIEWHVSQGNPALTLHWSSPSTPEEVIDPVIEQGLNLGSYASSCWADITKFRRWYSAKMADDNGQLNLCEGEYVIAEASVVTRGTYSLSFTGSADVTCGLFKGKFVVGDKELDALPAKGPGYDASTNTTRALLKVETDQGTFTLRFKNAFRDAQGTLPGITDLHIMRPKEIHSDQPCADDMVTYPPIKQLVQCFTALRWLEVANEPSTGLWKDRTPATHMSFSASSDLSKGVLARGENWERLIMFANETGRDLYVCTPMTADDEYFRKLALLLRYGSDGMEPYTQPTPNPKYPPLNPNLHIYFEVGNEIWNWAFPSSGDANKTSKMAVENKTEEGQIINYDGSANYRRYHAVRTIKASQIFREVFGDAAMGSRIRPLIEFQYHNAQNTASQSFEFIDHYYNNGDGEHVKEPHPARYYIWGGGGAAYYGVGNGEGTQTEVAFQDPSFEDTTLGDGEKSSAPGAWKFNGTAGVFRALSSAVTSYSSGKPINQPAKTAVGIRFHTGAQPIWVYQLGRVFIQGSDKGAHLSLLRADTLAPVLSGDTGRVQAYLTKIFGYYWIKTPNEKPVLLDPNTDYLLLSQDVDAPTRIGGFDTPIKVGTGLSAVKSVTVTMENSSDPKSWKIEEGDSDHCPGPVTLLYSNRPDVAVDLPQPPDGQQAAYLTGAGEISQEINFPKAGSYSLNINATPYGAGSTFSCFCDDQNANATTGSLIAVTPANFQLGGWGRNNGFKEEWGSGVFNITQPGKHTIRFVGTSKSTNGSAGGVVIDNVRVASTDAIMDSGFGGGSALGQPIEAEWGQNQMLDSHFPLTFGLQRVSYEMGWSLGGDFYQKAIQNWCKYRDPRATKINDKAIDIFTKAGGRLPVFGVYIYCPEDDFPHYADYPIIKSFIQASEHLPVDPTNGALIPTELNPQNAISWGGAGSDLKGQGHWLSWAVISPSTATYVIKVTTTGSGTFDAEVDGTSLGPVLPAGTPAEYQVKLTKGLHGIRIRSRQGEVSLQLVTVKPADGGP